MARRARSPIAFAALLVLALAACGSAARTTTVATNAAPRARGGTRLSKSARMVCGAEGVDEIAATLGVKTTRPVVGQWNAPVYSCRYSYANGSMDLSVRELPNVGDARAAFGALGRQLGARPSKAGLGQGTSQAPNGSVLVVKDDKVLDVDVQHLPARFGEPPESRSDVALAVAVTIMGCWTGA